MKNKAIILGVVGSLALLGTFLFPIWRITLSAPQYPDGINLYIWINKMSGDTPHTLSNINILNHYVGMKYIVPESIPELKYFPYIIIAMTFSGLLFAFCKNKNWVLLWLVVMLLLAIAGMVDFYMWGYDYGHNLDPKAPIKVPGMAYQPPLIGTQYLLNFKATSLPSTGSVFLGVGFLLNLIQFVLLRKKLKK